MHQAALAVASGAFFIFTSFTITTYCSAAFCMMAWNKVRDDDDDDDD